MRKTIWGLLGLIICLTACNPQQSETAQTKNNRVENMLSQLVLENEISGLCFSIIYPDGTQHSYASGFSDREEQVKMTVDHTLFSGSIGKTYAVAVLMQLVDEGRVSLNDRIMDHLSEVEWLNRLPNMDEITVAMCLQHTTGLPRYAMKEEVWAAVAENPDKVWTYEDRFSYVFDDEPVHEAGKGWAYSDTNYLLIGMLIERITGNGVYEEMKARVLEPQGLTHTYPSLTRDMPNLAVGYSRLPESFHFPEKTVVNGRYAFNPQMEWTGGGFASTTTDLARWAKLYFEGAVFPKTLLKQMTTPNSQGTDIGENTSYGMGSFIYDTAHGTCYGHTGFMPGYNSIFAYYPELGVAAALQINADYGRDKTALPAYLDRVLDVALDKPVN